MIRFQSDITHIILPHKFTFPFAYEPHQIAKVAVKELQQNLPLNANLPGKMYGVLVVQDKNEELGYLAAFSGQDEAPNVKLPFVPSVFDRLQRDDFYKQGEERLRAENLAIESIEQSAAYQTLQKDLKKAQITALSQIEQKRQENKAAKENRKDKRIEALANKDEALQKELEHQSIRDHFEFKDLKKEWKKKINELEEEVASFRLTERKQARKQQSIALQQQLFDQYQFLNKNKSSKSIRHIFPETPPSGAGDCAAPKLLQYAFKHDLTPIAMAEFWWGEAPKTQLRRHGHFYPACRGKCKPILTYMLEGISLDPDPSAFPVPEDKQIDLIYDDEYLAVIHKPEGLLSVPSKQQTDSVLSRMQALYPNATGNVVAHRLDWYTSGLMIIVKSESIYKSIQEQFTERQVRKKYIALLDGILNESEGRIDLPLAPDYDNRPRQMVSYEIGKPSATLWKVLSRENGRTRIEFQPLTGRTHQLRVHAAHPEGLNTPIVGDRLYGKVDERMFLHATEISFRHPVTNKQLTFSYPADF